MNSFDNYFKYVYRMINENDDFLDYYNSTDVTKDPYRLLFEVHYGTYDFDYYKELIERGAPVNGVNDYGKNFIECVDFLFAEKADLLRKQLIEYVETISYVKPTKS